MNPLLLQFPFHIKASKIISLYYPMEMNIFGAPVISSWPQALSYIMEGAYKALMPPLETFVWIEGLHGELPGSYNRPTRPK